LREEGRRGVAELGYDEVALRASKITHIYKQYYAMPAHINQLISIKMVTKKANRIIFVSNAKDNL
jgi:hypothetical protein